jgi:hypothetical protein
MGALYTICLVLATLWCWKLYTNWRQLSYVPGPPLAGFSDFWRAWYQRRGELRGKLIESHKRYGPIVRYGVHSVSLNDPKMIDIVYGSRAGFVVVSNVEGCAWLQVIDVLTINPGGFVQSDCRHLPW